MTGSPAALAWLTVPVAARSVCAYSRFRRYVVMPES